MSKGLVALERIKNAPTIYVGCASDVYTRYSHECKIIETALKALEIIKEKNVDICLLQATNKDEQYNIWKLPTSKKLEKKEYDLLKEVLL